MTLPERLELTRLFKKLFDVNQLNLIIDELGINLGASSPQHRDGLISELLNFADKFNKLPELKACVEAFYPDADLSCWPGTAGTASPAATKPQSTAPLATTAVSSDISARKVFYSYSHKDEALREKLETFLKTLQRQGYISEWHDRRITAGQEWSQEIDEHLRTAEIILLLISSDFIASDYCYETELEIAMQMHERKQARVVPLMMRPCDFKETPFAKLQGFPKDMKPVTSWSNEDEAFLNIAEGIRNLIKNWR